MIDFPTKTSGVKLTGSYVMGLKAIVIRAEHKHSSVDVVTINYPPDANRLAEKIARLLEEARDEGFKHGQAHVRQALGVG